MPDSLISIAIQLTGVARKEKFLDRDFLVAPAVLVRSQVLHNNLGRLYLPAEEITEEWAKNWNGIPVLIGEHPTLRGQPVTGRSPMLWNERCVGWIFNAKAENETNEVRRLSAEVWLDVSRSEVVGFSSVLANLNSGIPVELSTGFQVQMKREQGTFQGRNYEAVMRVDAPDHLVMSTTMTGACSVADGCGLGVNKFSGEQPMPEAQKDILKNAQGTTEGEATNDTPTQSVDGNPHPASDFAYVPDPATPSTWKLPIFDAAHTRNAIARFSQTDIPADAKAGVWKKIKRAASNFGIEVSDSSGPSNNSMIDKFMNIFKKKSDDVQNALTSKLEWNDQLRSMNLAPTSDNDRNALLRTALMQKYGSPMIYDVCVADVYSDSKEVVFWYATMAGPEPAGQFYYKVTYSENADGTIVIADSEPVKVRKAIVYEPVTDAAENADAGEGSRQATNCSCTSSHEESNMPENKKSVEDTLAEILEGQAAINKRMDEIAEKADDAVLAGLKKQMVDFSNELSSMKKVTQKAVEEKDREHKSLVRELAGNIRVPFTEAQLQEKPLEELQKIREMVSPDYAGRGGPRTATNAQDEAGEFMTPVPYWEVVGKKSVKGGR